MYKYVCTYDDYNGTTRNEAFRFDLSAAELTLMNLGERGGLKSKLENMLDDGDYPAIIKFFTELIHKAYGEISDDGRRFVKSDELSTAFEETPAYSKLFMELLNDPAFCREFISGIMPDDYKVDDAQIDAEINRLLNKTSAEASDIIDITEMQSNEHKVDNSNDVKK